MVLITFLITIARPKYVLKCDSMVENNIVEAVVGQNVVISYELKLCENTTLNEGTGHRITKVSNGTNRSRIKQNCITFTKVEKHDSGIYKIWCYDNNDIEGKENFTLKVNEGMFKKICNAHTISLYSLAPGFLEPT